MLPAPPSRSPLRVLESGEFFRVGGKNCARWMRVIAATNTNLAARVEENKFRRSLTAWTCIAAYPAAAGAVEDIPFP